MKKYIRNCLIALDQLANAITGGDPDETISSRFGKRSKSNAIRRAIDWLIFWEPKHCERNIEADEGRDALIK